MRLDPRITPARPDLAATTLKDRVEADSYVAGEEMQVQVPVLDVFATPGGTGGIITQLLFGERVRVFDRDPRSGLSWVQNSADDYVGYASSDGLGPVTAAPTHRVSTLGAQLYADAALKSRPLATLPYGAQVCAGETATNCGADFTRTPQGWIPSGQLAPIGIAPPDFVAEARRFLGVPYLWGGRSEQGLDCSSLIQLPLWAAGIPCGRDSDMQRDLGKPVERADQPGDLICWNGHIGILSAANTLLHANAYHMCVAEEPLDTAIARIGAGDTGPVTAIRRLSDYAGRTPPNPG